MKYLTFKNGREKTPTSFSGKLIKTEETSRQNISFALNGIEINLNTTKNSYALKFADIILKDCFVSVLLDGNTVSDFTWKLEKSSASKVVFSSIDKAGKWFLTFAGDSNAGGVKGICIVLEANMNMNKEYEKVSLSPLCIAKLKTEHILIHGRKCGGCRSFKFPVKGKHIFESYFQCILTAKDISVQFSHPLMQKNISTVSGTAESSFIKDFKVTTPVEPYRAKKLKSEPLWIYVSSAAHQLMINWAEDNKEEKNKRLCDSLSGWNSWDYYRWTITEDEVMKNAEFIASDPVLSRHIRRIIIDDGWQYCYGEWDANSLFPGGMAKLASSLKKMGFIPGLWFAPTIIEPHARIAQVETDMLAKGRAGLPCLAFKCMKRSGFVLDPTLEKTQKWIRKLFGRYNKMGYEYFKLDFLDQTLKAPCFSNKSIPRGLIIKNIIDSVKNAVSGDTRILACNYPFDAGTKNIDYSRIGVDTSPTWYENNYGVPSITEVVFAVAARFWCHNRFWINDPDFAVCRSVETANDPAMYNRRPLLVFVEPEEKSYAPARRLDSALNDANINEILVLLSLILISGGIINLSDNLPKLNKKGIELLRKIVSAPGGDAGIPLDLFSSERPAYWLQKTENGHRVLLINWFDEKSEFLLNLSLHNLYPGAAIDFWSGKSMKLKANTINTMLEAHSCLMLDIK